MGVPLTDNIDSKAFSSANICDTCDVLLTDSRARSDFLCAKIVEKPNVEAGKKNTHAGKMQIQNQHNRVGTPSTSEGAIHGETDPATRSFPDGSSARRSMSFSSMDTAIDTLSTAVFDLNSTVDYLSQQVAQLSKQNNFSQVATPYITCNIRMSWQQIGQNLKLQKESKTRNPDLVTGGLGRLMIPDKFEVWICSRHDLCAPGGDDFMCYVFDEKRSIFVPWGKNSELQLVKGGPFLGLHESTAAVALAEVRILREEVNRLKGMTISGGTLPLSASHVRKITSQQNVSSSLWRETAAIHFLPANSVITAKDVCHKIQFEWNCRSLDFCGWVGGSQVDPTWSGGFCSAVENQRRVAGNAENVCMAMQTENHCLSLGCCHWGLSPYSPSNWQCFSAVGKEDCVPNVGTRTISFSSALAVDKGRSTCFVSKQARSSFRFTAVETKYVGPGKNELVLSAKSPDFCLGNMIRVSNLQRVGNRFEISAFGGSPYTMEPLSAAAPKGLGAGYQPVAISLSNGRGALFYNFHAGQNFAHEETQRWIVLWDGAAAFRRISAVPLLTGLPGQPLLQIFGRVLVGTAHSGDFVWFAGGLEVTGDGPQGNVIRYNEMSPDSMSYVSSKSLPSLRSLTGIQILNVNSGAWQRGTLNSARFGVAGAGTGRFIVFAGGAQLGLADGTPVAELTWNVNIDSCVKQCVPRYGGYINGRCADPGCCFYSPGFGTVSDPRCQGTICEYKNCKAFTLEKAVINSNVVEVFDTGHLLDPTATIVSSHQTTLSVPRRFAAGAALPSLGLVLFAGGVTSTVDMLPQGGWQPSQTSSVVDMFRITDTGVVTRSSYSINAGRMVAGSSGNLIVLLRHHENAVFDTRAYIFDGSSWALTNHPGQCGVQESTAVTTRNNGALLVIFLSACEPEALLFDTSSRSWQTQQLTHSAGPSRVVATSSVTMLFAGQMRTVTNVTNASSAANISTLVYVETPALYGGGYYVVESVQSGNNCGTINVPIACPMPPPPSGTNGMCGWDGLGPWRSAGCFESSATYVLPPGFIKASVEISSLANPAQTILRNVSLPAHLPEVDVMLSLPNVANTSHLKTDTWEILCNARVEGQSSAIRDVERDGEVCITPHDERDDEFILY
jgi:hypothetical protein